MGPNLTKVFVEDIGKSELSWQHKRWVVGMGHLSSDEYFFGKVGCGGSLA